MRNRKKFIIVYLSVFALIITLTAQAEPPTGVPPSGSGPIQVLQDALAQEVVDREAADQEERVIRKDADGNIEASAQAANDSLQSLLEQAIAEGDTGVAAAAQTALAALQAKLEADLGAHAVDTSAHHVKTTDASELTTGVLPHERIADNSIPASKLANDSVTAGKLAANSVDTSEIVDGAVTSEKLSSGFIQNLLGLEVVTSTENVGNENEGPVNAIPELECPAGKTAIACGFQTDQDFWHIEVARPYGNKCIYSFTTCDYEQGSGGTGFVCPFSAEQVSLWATCVNDSAISISP